MVHEIINDELSGRCNERKKFTFLFFYNFDFNFIISRYVSIRRTTKEYGNFFHSNITNVINIKKQLI